LHLWRLRRLRWRGVICGFRRKPPTYSNLMPPIVLT
jgi:hypothetical protein